MENASEAELHELVVIRKNDDVTESFEELLDLPEEESRTKTSMVGHVFAPPEGKGASFLELDPGGSASSPRARAWRAGPMTNPADLLTSPLGMHTEFTVE